MTDRNFRRNKKGQVLVISALLVALILLSTAIYVMESEKSIPTAADENNVFPAYKQAARNTVISALANITNGGNPNTLTTDLNELESAITSQSYQALTQINFMPLTNGTYQNGLWISWGSNGQGISGGYVTLNVNATGTLTTSTYDDSINITSEADLSGNYEQINSTSNQVNLTINIYNEGKPALARDFTFYFENATNWALVDSPIITNFGNGTYTAAFVAENNQQTNPFVVSMFCQDQRGILIGANATCTSVQ